VVARLAALDLARGLQYTFRAFLRFGCGYCGCSGFRHFQRCQLIFCVARPKHSSVDAFFCLLALLTGAP
jgi:hypothetical protein